MGIVTRSCTKAAIFMLAGKYKVDGLVPREGVRATEEVEGRETPVKTVESQVFSQPVFILVFARVEALDIAHMGRGDETEFVGNSACGGSHICVAGFELERSELRRVDEMTLDSCRPAVVAVLIT